MPGIGMLSLHSPGRPIILLGLFTWFKTTMPFQPDISTAKARTIFTHKVVIILCALIPAILWGSAFPVVKLGYELLQIGPLDLWAKILFAGYRMMAASLLLLLIARFQGQALRALTRP